MLSMANYKLFVEYAKTVPKQQIIGAFDQNGNFSLYPQEEHLISQTYKLFYCNTLRNDLQAGKEEKFSFAPTINSNSEKLAGSYRRKIQLDSCRIELTEKEPGAKDRLAQVGFESPKKQSSFLRANDLKKTARSPAPPKSTKVGRLFEIAGNRGGADPAGQPPQRERQGPPG